MTDATIDAAVESLLSKQTEPEAETAEEPQEDAPEAEEDTEEESNAEEAEAEENEADESDESDDDESEGDESDEEEDADEEPETYTVKVDGQEVQVSLDELTRSYSGQEYIQKGMQEAAAKKKEAESLYQNLQSAQQEFLQTLQGLQEQGVIHPPQKPDAELLQTDPIGYMEAQAKFEAQNAEYQKQQAEIKRVKEQNENMQAQAMQQYLAQQQQILAERIPEFADPNAASKVKERLRSVGAEYGFSEDELGSIVDARHVQVLNDAAKWRELQASKAKAKKTPKAPRTVKPSARREKPTNVVRTEMKQKARKTGKVEDFAALLLEPKSG